MSQPLITIAITACNDQRHLSRAIDSALAQTGIDKDVIVVDDGSTDSTPLILSRYNDRVKVITHSHNCGLVTARRTAIENARGEWITMLDGDDWLSPNAIEAALWNTRDVDIVQMRINLRLQIFPWIPIHWKQRYDPDRAVDAMIYDEHAFPVQVWGKLYRPDMLQPGVDTIDYDGFWGEDRLVNLPIMLRQPRIAVAHKAYYNYRMGGRSQANRLATLEQVKRVNTIKREYLESRCLLTKRLSKLLDEELERHTRYLTR